MSSEPRYCLICRQVHRPLPPRRIPSELSRELVAWSLAISTGLAWLVLIFLAAPT